MSHFLTRLHVSIINIIILLQTYYYIPVLIFFPRIDFLTMHLPSATSLRQQQQHPAKLNQQQHPDLERLHQYHHQPSQNKVRFGASDVVTISVFENHHQHTSSSNSAPAAAAWYSQRELGAMRRQVNILSMHYKTLCQRYDPDSVELLGIEDARQSKKRFIRRKLKIQYILLQQDVNRKVQILQRKLLANQLPCLLEDSLRTRSNCICISYIHPAI